jgi:hypothetical protein
MRYRDWRKRGDAEPVDIHKIIPSCSWMSQRGFIFITDLKGRRMVLEMSRSEMESLGKDMMELAKSRQ